MVFLECTAVAVCHCSLCWLSCRSTPLVLLALFRSCLPAWLVRSLGAESTGFFAFLMYSVSPPRMIVGVTQETTRACVGILVP